jgi:hypothetical protein
MRPSRRSSRWGSLLCLERLEDRCLLSGVAGSSPTPGRVDITENEPNDTLNHASDIGPLDRTVSGTTPLTVALHGTIGNSPAAGADVDWFHFSLNNPATVSFHTGAAMVLGLYNNASFDPGDPFTPFGHQLLEQESGPSGTAIVRSLTAGDYYLAVSGAGNLDFNPLLADSGLPGQTGPYEIDAAAVDIPESAGNGPQVLATDPAPGAALLSSPLVLRVNFDHPIDPTTVVPDDNVQLLYLPAGAAPGTDYQILSLSNYSTNDAGDELRLFPSVPLAPGNYQLVLRGDSSSLVHTYLADLNGIPLGATADNQTGQDQAIDFRVNGSEGIPGTVPAEDDTIGTARRLGNITTDGPLLVAGTIGNDPTDPIPFDPSQVNLYQFQVTGSGRYALTAEAFAGRIGSPLDATLSLFQVESGQVALVATAGPSRNPAVGSDERSLPLFSDPVLFAGLTAGQYYLAVSSQGNDPASGTTPGFDILTPHSGSNGQSDGDYVLSLLVQPANEAPQVLSVNPGPGTTLSSLPQSITVNFSEVVDLPQLATLPSPQGITGELSSVYIEGANGTRYYPRLASFDPSSGAADFQLLDALPNGDYTLHIVGGTDGVTDLAGNPLVGNDGSDFTSHFTVEAPPRGTAGNPLLWVRQANPGNDVGPLFPMELAAGVTLARPLSPETKTTDSWSFGVLQSRRYLFTFGAGATPGLQLQVLDAGNNPVPDQVLADGSILAALAPGSYKLVVSAPTKAAVGYDIRISLFDGGDSPLPLSLGPSPAVRLRLAIAAPPAPAPPTPPASGPTAPASGGGNNSSAGTDPTPTAGTPAANSSDSGPPVVRIPTQPLTPAPSSVLTAATDNSGSTTGTPKASVGVESPTSGSAIGPVSGSSVSVSLTDSGSTATVTVGATSLAFPVVGAPSATVISAGPTVPLPILVLAPVVVSGNPTPGPTALVLPPNVVTALSTGPVGEWGKAMTTDPRPVERLVLPTASTGIRGATVSSAPAASGGGSESVGDSEAIPMPTEVPEVLSLQPLAFADRIFSAVPDRSALLSRAEEWLNASKTLVSPEPEAANADRPDWEENAPPDEESPELSALFLGGLALSGSWLDARRTRQDKSRSRSRA